MLIIMGQCFHAPLPLLLHPFFDMLGQTSSNVTFSRIKDSLLNPALNFLTTAPTANNTVTQPRKRIRVSAPDYTFLSTHSCIQPKIAPESPNDVKRSLLEAVFASASHADTRDSNRRKLYAIWKIGMLELETSDTVECGD
jgi:ribosomal RNA-processing protein 1